MGNDQGTDEPHPESAHKHQDQLPKATDCWNWSSYEDVAGKRYLIRATRSVRLDDKYIAEGAWRVRRELHVEVAALSSQQSRRQAQTTIGIAYEKRFTSLGQAADQKNHPPRC